MTFRQQPPTLGNQYDDDDVLRSYLRRALPHPVLANVEDSLREMGALAGGDLYRLQLADRRNEPILTRWDAWGNRIDNIEHTATKLVPLGLDSGSHNFQDQALFFERRISRYPHIAGDFL